MGRLLHRAQVLLRPDQYERLKGIARARTADEKRRVTVSRVIRELLDEGLAEQARDDRQAREAVEFLAALGVRVASRRPQPLAEDWFDVDRREHDDDRFADLIPRG